MPVYTCTALASLLSGDAKGEVGAEVSGMHSEVNHVQLIPSGGPLSLAQATSTWDPDPTCK